MNGRMESVGVNDTYDGGTTSWLKSHVKKCRAAVLSTPSSQSTPVARLEMLPQQQEAHHSH